MEIKNPNKIISAEAFKYEPAAKINLGTLNANDNLAKKDELLVGNNDEDFLKNLDKDILKSLQSEVLTDVKKADSKGIVTDKPQGFSSSNIISSSSSKDAKSKLDNDEDEDENSDFDFP